MRRMRRVISLVLVAAVIAVLPASCGKSRRSGAPPVTFRIMSWNEDFRDLMETYFIPRHPELMENVTVEWVIDEINAYQSSVQRRLANGEQIDLFLGDNETAPFFAANENVASLAELGIQDSELSHQFAFTRTLGSSADGVQKGSAFAAEPGILLYRSDYAEKYFGITSREEMQEKLSSWETFISTARTLNEKSDGKVKMLPNSAELWKSVDCAMSGRWLKDGKLAVSDDTAAYWLNTVKELESVGAFANVKTLDDKWYNAIDSGVFCFYASPWLCKGTPSDSAGITTIFSSSRSRGASFGRFKTSLAPGGFVYGGSWLYCPKSSSHKDLAAAIIRAFTADAAFMKLVALAEMQYVNHDAVCEEIGAMQIGNPLFDGLDAFSVYTAAAKGLELAIPTVYDSSVSQSLYDQAKDYGKGKIRLSDATAKFRTSVRKKHEEIMP